MSSTIQASLIRTEGTSVIFKTNPTVGLIALVGFADDATGGGGLYFKKSFRYTTNGVIYSSWEDLTIDNILAIEVNQKDVFIIEVNYTRVPSTAPITVTDLTFEGTYDLEAIDSTYFDNSLFGRYFDIADIDSLNWHINVLEKIYAKGLIPNFIDRLDDFGSPDDFLALWGSVTKLFSYYVVLAKKFSQFYDNEKLLREFLTQRGLIISPENTLSELQNFMMTYYFQMGRRGTNSVMENEVLRLIHSKIDTDEYMWCLYRKHHFGWNLGNSSPLYRGLRINDSLNKVPWSLKAVNLDEADTYTSGTITVDNSIDQKVVSLNAQQIGFIGPDAILIDPRLDYQISFKIKLTSGKFSLDAIGYDKDDNIINLKSKKTGANRNFFFSQSVLSRDDMYLTVKCYLYNKDSGISTHNKTNINQGNNLLSVSNLAKIGLTWSANEQAGLYDFRIVPMITEYSRGFIQTNNFISVWLLNRNGEYGIYDIKDYITKYLIPYNCHLKITEINNYALQVIDPPIETFYWLGAGEYCRKIVWIGTDPSCELINLIWVPDEDTAYCEQ